MTEALSNSWAVCRLNKAGVWEDDPLIMDERYVAVNLRGKGPILFSACSHAGIINVLTDLADVSNTRGMFWSLFKPLLPYAFELQHVNEIFRP